MSDDEQQSKALKYLIKSAPGGEMLDVLHHLGTLVGGQEKLASNDKVQASLKSWFQTHMVHIKVDDSYKALVTASGARENDEQGNFVYYDNIQGKTFSFNPFSMEGQTVSESAYEKQSALRDALIGEMDTYMQKAYGKGKALYNIHQHDDEGTHLTIEISVHNDKLEAFWSGEWISVWVLENGQLTGSLKVRSHYFEMGNMQFNLDKKFENVACKDAASAKEILKTMQKVEDKYQSDLEDMYDNIQENLLKRVRRFVPLTGQKFDWTQPLGVYR